MKKRPAAFFDRDGVLNKDVGYLYKKEDFVWQAGAIDAIKYCDAHGYLVIVITNQSGVARGYYTEADVVALHSWMNEELKKHGTHIDDFFYCPHYIDGVVKKYKVDCDCRKPSPKLINWACQKYGVDKTLSFMVGDKISDIECAEKAGIEGRIFLSGNLKQIITEIIREKQTI